MLVHIFLFLLLLKEYRMRILSIISSLLFVFGSINAQPLQFIDKNDGLDALSIDVNGDDFGGWFAAIVKSDSSLAMLQFDYCGAVEQSHVLELSSNVRASQIQSFHLGMRKYLITAVIHEGLNSRILVFYTNNAIISSAKLISSRTASFHSDPMLSVLDENNILLGFQYQNQSGNASSRVVLLDSLLNPKWSKHLSDDSRMKWILMSAQDEFYVGDGFRIRKYDDAGQNLWTRQMEERELVYNSVLKIDTAIVFLTDYLDPIPDTGQVKRVKYKQLLALDEEDGAYVWESSFIRNLRMSGILNEYNNHLFINAQQEIVFHGIDTLPGDSIPSLLAHKLNKSGNLIESVVTPAGDSVRDYKASMINDGNVAFCAVLGNDSLGRGFLSIKASKRLDVCDSVKFNSTIRRFVSVKDDVNRDVVDSTLNSTAFNFRAVEDSFMVNRVCEKFELKDAEIPTPLCKGDSVFLAGIQIPNATYVWSNGAGQSGTWVKEPGKYILTITYCGKTVNITYDVFYITFQDVIWPDIETCDYPRRLFANRDRATSYVWSTGATTSFLDVNGPGTYTVNITECEFTYRMTFNVKLPNLPSSGYNFNACIYPDTLYPFQAPGATYVWEDRSTNGFRIVNNPGTYVATINFCMQSFTNTFVVQPLKDFNLFISAACDSFPIPLAVIKPKGVESVKWNNGKTTDTIQVAKAGIYTATVGECTEKFTVAVKEDEVLKFPNVFSPNSQIMENQVFKPYIKPEQVMEISRYELVIFNRWGEKVFESTDLAKGWDGLDSKGNMSPMETYTFYANYYRGNCGEEKRIKASVSLIR